MNTIGMLERGIITEHITLYIKKMVVKQVIISDQKLTNYNGMPGSQVSPIRSFS